MPIPDRPKACTAAESEALLGVLHTRFTGNPERHTGIVWHDVLSRLKARPEKLWSLARMERSGGEPDLIGRDERTAEYLFCDCAAESPAGRRSLCYDRESRLSRKENQPENSALEYAAEMGVDLLNEAQYRTLQKLGDFDRKTSSWIRTPDAIREHGGALFGDRRYAHVFVYHNGAQSYYAARGFRGLSGCRCAGRPEKR